MIDPEHGVAWRVKSSEAIRAKILALSSQHGRNLRTINDCIGIRILVSHSRFLEEVERGLERWHVDLGLVQVGRSDTFQVPDESGYRAIHLDYEFANAQQWNLPEIVAVEVQLTTWLQHLHGSLAHTLFYKNMGVNRTKMATQLRELSKELHRIELSITELLSG
jgi:ppGpp synthetase/RelA/SpoT-type nucleotidyltranferase